MAKEPKEQGREKEAGELICGMAMPISRSDGFPDTHWIEVRAILESAITAAGFKPRIVSTADTGTVIQKDIVDNLYFDPIVVCDVSSGNPNVMLELGMRLAFDKPTVVVKDDQTPFNFDIGPLRHVVYPRNLRHAAIEGFKIELSKTVMATHQSSTKPGYTSFLKSFGTFNVAKLEQKEVSPLDYKIASLQNSIVALTQRLESSQPYRGSNKYSTLAAISEKVARQSAAYESGILIEKPVIAPDSRKILVQHFGGTGWKTLPTGELVVLVPFFDEGPEPSSIVAAALGIQEAVQIHLEDYAPELHGLESALSMLSHGQFTQEGLLRVYRVKGRF